MEFIKRLSYDEDIAKCMISASPNFKQYILNEGDMDNLIWSQIFPCRYIVETQNNTKSYITMSFKYKRVRNANIWKAGYITFYIFCHQDIVCTSYGILRYDYLLECIDRLINNTNGISWIGKMQFDNMEDIIVDSAGKYVGIAVTYKNMELM